MTLDVTGFFSTVMRAPSGRRLQFHLIDPVVGGNTRLSGGRHPAAEHARRVVGCGYAAFGVYRDETGADIVRCQILMDEIAGRSLQILPR